MNLKVPSNYFVNYNTSQDKVLIYLENEISKTILYTYKDNPEILYIANLSVDANMRNKGIGTQLLSIAEDIADQINIKNNNSFCRKEYLDAKMV